MHADMSRPRPGDAQGPLFESLLGLSGDLWPIHPHRLKEELLSSWIVRTAHANRLKLQTFTSLSFGREAALWNRDVDRSASDELLGILSRHTGSSIDEIRAGTLASYDGILFERHNANGNTRWILPLGIYHRTRKRFGVQFCPLCLFSDPVPYFRRQWRLAFTTVCDRHGTMMHDRCPACGSPVIYFRNDLGKRTGYRIGDLVSCWKCGSDLRRVLARSPIGGNGKIIMALRSLVAFHDLGWWFQGERHLQYGHLYFDALHHLVTCLSAWRGKRLLAAAEAETGCPAEVLGAIGRNRFDLRPVGERHRIMVAALWLLDDWPERFVRIAKSSGLTQARILRGETLPYWYEFETRTWLGAKFASPTTEEASRAAAYLSANGLRVGSRAVGRLIGSRDAASAKSFAIRQSRPVSDREMIDLFERLDADIEKALPFTPARLLLQRDRAILRFLRLTGWTTRKTLSLTVSAAVGLASTPKWKRAYPGELAGVILAYLRDTRRYLAGEKSGDGLFIGWKRGAITENAWRLRLARVRDAVARVEVEMISA